MSKNSNLFICVTLALLAAITLSACSPGGNPSPGDQANQGNSNNGSSSGAPTNTGGGSTTGSDTTTSGDSTAGDDSTSVDSIPTDWQISAHAQTYVLDGVGENSACTKCHSPLNFIPTVDEIPQSCFICKFEVSEPPPLTAQDVWQNIQCKICHEPDNKGNIPAEYSWLEVPILEQYAEVSSSSELCLNCHIQIDLPGHKPQVDLANAHAAMLCSDCHNSHSLKADCSSSGCHDNVMSSGGSIAGHDTDHQNVSCIACHQVGGLPDGMDDASGQWLPLLEISVVDGSTELLPYASHDISRQSACDTCHFSGNPWDLSITTGQ
ncbi:hypothetical protein ACFLTX_03035 [Chloroflexota bacterium]